MWSSVGSKARVLHISSPEFGKGEEDERNCVNMVISTVNKRTYHIESFFSHVKTCFLETKSC